MAGPIRIKRGQTLQLQIPLTQDENGGVFDLTGWTVTSEVRELVEGANRAYRLVATLDTSATDHAAGTVSLTATAAQTNNWPAKTLYYDVWLRSPEGVDVPLPTAQIAVEERVSGYD